MPNKTYTCSMAQHLCQLINAAEVQQKLMAKTIEDAENAGKKVTVFQDCIIIEDTES